MKNTDNFIFGDIVAAEIPFSNLEETKIRPVLIISKDKDDYLIMKITSNTLNKSYNDLIIEVDNCNNLKTDSVIKILKIWSFSKEILRRKIWELNLENKNQVKENLINFIEKL